MDVSVTLMELVEVDGVKMESHQDALEPVKSDLSPEDHVAGMIIANLVDVFVGDVSKWEMV